MSKLKILSFVSLLLTGFCAFAKPQPLDGIAAVVNDTIISRSELAEQVSLIGQQMKQNANGPLNEKALEKQVLEHLISNEIQLGLAKKTGIHVEEPALDNAIAEMAKHHNMSVSQLREALNRDGIDFNVYRNTIKNQMIISQLQQRDVLMGIHVSDQEVNQFLQSPNGLGEMTHEYHLAHLLIPLSQTPSAKELEAAKLKASTLVKQLRKGKAFSEIALEEAHDDTALKGGDLGWHKLAELPTLFVKIVPQLKAKEIPEPIQSPSGLHIIQLLEKRSNSQSQASVESTNVRHILIKTNNSTSDKDAKQRLLDLKAKLKKGADFAQLAKTHSADLGSASNGGSIGWVSQEAVVPEFRSQMQKTAVNEISEPFKTPFGWHILQVVERKSENSEQASLRLKAKDIIRQRKAQEKTQTWARQLRDEAYVKTYYDS